MVGSKHSEMKTASSQIQCRAFMLHIQCENHAFNAWGSYNIWWYLTFSEQRAASYDPAWNERKDHHFWFLLLESWSPAQHTRAYGSSIPDEWTFAYASTQCEAMTDGSMRTYFLVWGIVNYDEITHFIWNALMECESLTFRLHSWLCLSIPLKILRKNVNTILTEQSYTCDLFSSWTFSGLHSSLMVFQQKDCCPLSRSAVRVETMATINLHFRVLLDGVKCQSLISKLQTAKEFSWWISAIKISYLYCVMLDQSFKWNAQFVPVELLREFVQFSP